MPEQGVRDCRKLILLVGSNPLPNYLATQTLKPDELVLLASRDTVDPRDRLKELLEDAGGVGSIQTKTVEDAKDFAEIRNVVTGIQGLSADGTYLDYTGGTKVMSACSRMAFSQNKQDLSRSSYVDEKKGKLRFDDGTSEDLDCSSLDFDAITRLHGVEVTSTGTRLWGFDDLEELAKLILDEPDMAGFIYEHGKGLPDDDKKRLYKVYELLISILSRKAGALHGQPCNKKDYERWIKFSGGGWLEEWVEHLINSCDLKDPPIREICTGINLKRHTGRELEVDVVVIRGHRVFVVSCTTDAELSMCKLKAFEAALRARQLGGDMARSAITCFLDNQRVSILKKDVESAWAAPNTPEVFGLEDLKEWSGTGGASVNLTSLTNWLDQKE